MTGRSSQHISDQPASAAARQHDGVLTAVRRLWRVGEASAASHPLDGKRWRHPGGDPGAHRSRGHLGSDCRTAGRPLGAAFELTRGALILLKDLGERMKLLIRYLSQFPQAEDSRTGPETAQRQGSRP